MADGLRLAVGTLSIVPTPVPGVVDRRSGAWAMTFAPLVGALLALAAVVLQILLGWGPNGDAAATGPLLFPRPASPLVTSALTVGLLALLTRGIHLDGLADTADGLGSGKPADAALAVMRRGDIGPFGVVTLVLVLLAQVAALADLLTLGRGPLAVTLALVVSRLVLPLVCSRRVPPARPEGLGRAVAGTVGPLHLLVAVALACAVAAPFAVVAPFGVAAPFGVVAGGVVVGGVAVAALLTGAGLCWWAVRRLGGITGDVMGACVEVTFTVTLVVLAMV